MSAWGILNGFCGKRCDGIEQRLWAYNDPKQGGHPQVDPIGLGGGNSTLYGDVSDPNAVVDFFGLRRADHFLGGSGSGNPPPDLSPEGAGRNVRILQ